MTQLPVVVTFDLYDVYATTEGSYILLYMIRFDHIKKNGKQVQFDSSYTTRSASETCPKNVAFNYIVKAE